MQENKNSHCIKKKKKKGFATENKLEAQIDWKLLFLFFQKSFQVFILFFVFFCCFFFIRRRKLGHWCDSLPSDWESRKLAGPPSPSISASFYIYLRIATQPKFQIAFLLEQLKKLGRQWMKYLSYSWDNISGRSWKWTRNYCWSQGRNFFLFYYYYFFFHLFRL